MATQQEQITDLYNSYTSLVSLLNDLALNSRLITIEDSLKDSLNSIATSVSNLESQVRNIQLELADIIQDLKNS